ncbi:hypothetical protein KC361_g6385 [Hortaea werneckii]|nr:hypothetical protein KC361_g6385 [Hortaea werneckii]
MNEQTGQPPSERACDRCRERRVKCDKRQPTCLRCEKLGKPCPGYDKKRKFVDEGVSLRRKYQSTSDRVASGEAASDATSDHDAVSSNTPAFSVHGYSPSQASQRQRASSKAISVPEEAPSSQPRLGSVGDIVASNPTLTGPIEARTKSTAPSLDPVNEQPVLFPEANFALQGIQDDAAHGEFWDGGNYDPAWFNIEPELYYGNNNNSCGFIPNAHIIDEVDRNDLRSNTDQAAATPMSGMGSSAFSNFWAPESQLNTSAIITDEREHEMAYLIRHFTEAIGPWMDLFDKDEHFAHLVPLKALRDALLRNAIAAVAAKQLGRVKGHKPFVGRQCQRPAYMEVIEDGTDINWYYKAANYYDKAIASSRTYLAALSGSFSRPPSPNEPEMASLGNSDDLLIAVSIFSLYESLDNMETAGFSWLQHLTGLKSLLMTVGSRQQDQLQMAPSITIGRLASFWNFARADYQAAYINRQRTLLDTEDLQLWRNCGLQIQDNGSLYANPPNIKNEPLQCRHVAQLVAHTLLYLVLRTVNYVSLDSDQDFAERQNMWEQISFQLDMWHENLPETFRPCAQIRHPMPMQTQRNGSSSQLTEVFFSIKQCAAAIQLYHFARILLLLEKPSRRSGMSRLKAYREVSTEAIMHAREIIGIALGRPHPAVRVEMNLPLYVAGGCLEAEEERRVVLDLLKAMEQDTGCSTDVKVRSLVDEWGWNIEPQAVN